MPQFTYEEMVDCDHVIRDIDALVLLLESLAVDSDVIWYAVKPFVSDAVGWNRGSLPTALDQAVMPDDGPRIIPISVLLDDQFPATEPINDMERFMRTSTAYELVLARVLNGKA